MSKVLSDGTAAALRRLVAASARPARAEQLQTAGHGLAPGMRSQPLDYTVRWSGIERAWVVYLTQSAALYVGDSSPCTISNAAASGLPSGWYLVSGTCGGGGAEVYAGFATSSGGSSSHTVEVTFTAPATGDRVIVATVVAAAQPVSVRQHIAGALVFGLPGFTPQNVLMDVYWDAKAKAIKKRMATGLVLESSIPATGQEQTVIDFKEYNY